MLHRHIEFCKLFAADSALAPADEVDQVRGFGRPDLGVYPAQRFLEFQARTVQKPIGVLKGSYLGRAEARSFQSDKIYAFGLDIESGVKKEWRDIAINASIAADHGQAPDLGELVDHDAAGDERLILDFNVTRDQGATADDGAVADPAIMSDVPRGHDVIVVADPGDRLRLRAPRHRIVLPDDVAV